MLRFIRKPMLKQLICIFITAIIMISTLYTSEAFAAANTTTSRTVSIFETEGSVVMTKGTDKEFKVKEGLNLYDGYTVSTGSDSYCQLKLDDGSLLKLDQNSKLKVSKASSKKLSISVLSGGLSVDAQKQKSGDEVEIRVGNTSLAIRGTYFTVESVTGKSAVYTMFEGSGVVDGIDLPSRHIMNVYSRDSKAGSDSNTQSFGSAKEELVHELTEFKIDKSTSAFVLQTVLDDVDRFIENGVINKSDIPDIEKLLSDKLEEIKKRAEAPAYNTYASYYMPGSSGGNYSGGYIDTINKTYLTDAINLAKYVAKAVFINTSASNVYIGFDWVTQADMDILNAAVTDAENLYSRVTTMDQINNAVTQLFMTLLRFERSKKQGTKPPSPEIRILQTAIVKSSNAKENVSISIDGSDVYVDSYWVPVKDMNAMNTAVADAYDVTKAAMAATATLSVKTYTASTAPSFQMLTAPVSTILSVQTFAASPIETAARELSNAVISFNAAKRPGTKPLDKDKLREAIDHAILVAGDIKISINGYDIDANEYWITKDYHDAFLSGIASAEQQYNTAATQQEITLAIYSINQWVYAVIDTMQWGKKEPAVPLTDDDRYELRRAIADAKDTLVSVIKSEGYGMASDTLWVLPWLHDYLSSAVSYSENMLNTVKSIGQVYEEANKLDKILSFFIECTMKGPLTELPMPESMMRPLLDAVNAAKAVMEGVIVSDKGDDLDEGTRWILSSTYDLLRKEWTYATAALKSGQNIMARTDALNSAISVFKDCIVTVKVDKSILIMYIEHAYKLMNDIMISYTGDGTDIDDTGSWVTEEAYNEIITALTAAKDILDTVKKQSEIDDAALILVYEIVKFQGAIQSGKVWVNQRTGDMFRTLVYAVDAAASGDTIVLIGNGLIPLSVKFDPINGVTNNPLGIAFLDNINLVINEDVTLTIDGGELSAFGGSKITNNGTIINGGSIIIGIGLDKQNSNGTLINNGVINNNERLDASGTADVINNGEFNNNINATASIRGSFNNTRIVNNYSQNYLAALQLNGGMLFSGYFKNAETGKFNNYPDATAEMAGLSENYGIINNYSMGKFIFEDLIYGSLPGMYFVYRNGLTLGGIFNNIGTISNSPNKEYTPNSINVPIGITDYFINSGTVNNHNQLTITGDCNNVEYGRLNNSGNINISSKQCIFDNDAVFVNDGSVSIFNAELKFTSDAMITNQGILTILDDQVFGTYFGKLIYESKKPFINVGDIFVYGRFDYITSAVFTNEKNISIEKGSFIISDTADFINNKNISTLFGGTLNFVSSGRLENHGLFNIYADFFGEPQGSFIYRSNQDIVNSGELVMNGGITINGDVKLIGKAGAKVEIGHFVSGTFRSDFYDSLGTGVQGRIPEGEYLWDNSLKRWVRQKPFDPSEQNIDTSTLAAVIGNAEFIKNFVVVSTNGAGLPVGTLWVTEFDMFLLDTALANAKDKLNAVTQEDIDKAEAELNTRIELFTAAIQRKSPDKNALEAAIAEAKILNTEVMVSKNGTGTDIPAGRYWVTAAYMEMLENYLGSAEYVLQNAVTQMEIDSEVNYLNSAINIIKSNMVIASLDKSKLEEAVNKAETILAGLDPLDFNAMILDIMINEAKKALANATTQAEIDTALNELKSMLIMLGLM